MRSAAVALVALLVVGLTNIIRVLSGLVLSGLVLGFMRPRSRTGATVVR